MSGEGKYTASGTGEFQIEYPRLALRQCERRAMGTPTVEQIGVALIARLQVVDGNRDIRAWRQTADREFAVLIRTRALDETRVRPPLVPIVGEHDHGRVKREPVPVVRYAT